MNKRTPVTTSVRVRVVFKYTTTRAGTSEAVIAAEREDWVKGTIPLAEFVEIIQKGTITVEEANEPEQTR